MPLSPQQKYRDGLRAWFATPLGHDLLQAEAQALRALLPAVYFPLTVQVGGVPLAGVMESVNSGVCAVLMPPLVMAPTASTAVVTPPLTVHARPEMVPFGEHSVDLALMPHTLDLCADPHAVLREAAQAVAVDGHIAVVGFNPHGLWAWLNWLRPASPSPPRRGCHYPMAVVQDWLALLGFEPVSGQMVYYRPPFVGAGRPRPQRWHERLAFMERAGPRWWPFAAAAYVLVARKKTLRMMGATARARARPAMASAASAKVSVASSVAAVVSATVSRRLR